MAKVRDPNGTELVPTLLHVLERDDCGNPTVCRVRYDDEKILLERDEPEAPAATFLIVWAPREIGGVTLPIVDVIAKANEAHELRATVDAARRETAMMSIECDRARSELEQKTAALRDLQKERDPQRMERAVQERTVDLQRQLTEARSRAASEASLLRSRIAELETSKKKLRDALERIKDGRK